MVYSIDTPFIWCVLLKNILLHKAKLPFVRYIETKVRREFWGGPLAHEKYCKI